MNSKIHLICGGDGGIYHQLEEFFAYYKEVLKINNIHFCHHNNPYNQHPEFGLNEFQALCNKWKVETTEHQIDPRLDDQGKYNPFTCLPSGQVIVGAPSMPLNQGRIVSSISQKIKNKIKEEEYSDNWVLYVDIDEFLYIEQGKTLEEYISEIEPSVGGVEFRAYLFGLGEKTFEAGDLVTESTFHGAPNTLGFAKRLENQIRQPWPSWSKNGHDASLHKSMYRLSEILYAKNKLARGWIHTLSEGKEIKLYRPGRTEAAINHYSILHDPKNTDEDFWLTKKGIPNKLFRSLLNEDILNSEGRDFKKVKGWTDSIEKIKKSLSKNI